MAVSRGEGGTGAGVWQLEDVVEQRNRGHREEGDGRAGWLGGGCGGGVQAWGREGWNSMCCKERVSGWVTA